MFFTSSPSGNAGFQTIMQGFKWGSNIDCQAPVALKQPDFERTRPYRQWRGPRTCTKFPGAETRPKDFAKVTCVRSPGVVRITRYEASDMDGDGRVSGAGSDAGHR